MADISQIKLPNGDTFDIVDEKSGFSKIHIVHFVEEWDETTETYVINLDATYQEISGWITNEETVVLLNNEDDSYLCPFYFKSLQDGCFTFKDSYGGFIEITNTGVISDYSYSLDVIKANDGGYTHGGYVHASYYDQASNNGAQIWYGADSNNSWISLDADNITINGIDVSNLDLSNYVKNYYSDNLSAYIVPTYFDESFGQIYYSRTLSGSNPQTLTASIDYGIGRNSSNESYSFINLGADQIAIVGTFRLSSTYLNSNSLTIGMDTLTDSRTINFPNKSGTIALTSDIPDVSNFISIESDPVFTAHPAYYVTYNRLSAWDNKLDGSITTDGDSFSISLSGNGTTTMGLYTAFTYGNYATNPLMIICDTTANTFETKIYGIPTPTQNDMAVNKAYVDNNTSKVQIIRW